MNHAFLPRTFFNRDTVAVARDLLGKRLVRIYHGVPLIGIIVETEAYRSDDPASHSYRGQSLRNRSLFGPVGHVYIYVSYGIHFCLNIVARDTHRYVSGGVLIRAVLPVEHVEHMLKFRPVRPSLLADGPGKLTQALGITHSLDGSDVLHADASIQIRYGIDIDSSCVEVTKRIGISKAPDNLWRFMIRHDCYDTIRKLYVPMASLI